MLMKNTFKLVGMMAVISFITLSDSAFAKDNAALNAKHQKIIKDFPAVQHISNETLRNLSKDELILFDIREADEFEVSHMEGAVLVPPSSHLDTFLTKYSERVKGKTVVFYCSVGQRSSIIAEKVQDELINMGAGSVYNLEGGLFKWHNDGLPLMTPRHEITEYIHPYNYFWGRMVNDKRAKRYKSEDK